MSGSGELRISGWAIRNPIPIVVLFTAANLAGLISYGSLPIKNYPNVEFPAVIVTITRNGAAPAEMESQVTRPVENAVAGLSNIENIQSTIVQGSSETFIQFHLGQNLQKAADDVQSKVDAIRNALPRDIDPPVVQRIEIDDRPIVTYAVTDPAMSATALSWFIDNTLSRTLQAETGVSRISRLGGADREINVVVDPARLAAHDITAAQLNAVLSQVDLDAPGGRVAIGGREQTLRVLGAALSVAQIRNLLIPTPSGGFLRLSDVADVGDGEAEPRGFALLDGRPVVGFQLSKTKDASEVGVEDRADAALRLVEKTYPGVHIHKIVSRVDQTRASFSATLHTLLEGMALAAVVVWLFLRDWRATAVTAIAMPASLIPTFAFMRLAGFSLNIVTLLGLTLVIGILVDDAIVEIENIEKRVHTGMRPFAAAIEGADQIGLAVVACTFAIVAVFLPTAFMPGVNGQFFREFGVTVSVAVLVSLVVARLLTPLMAAYALKPKTASERAPLPRLYTRTLTWALNHRWVAAGIFAVIFVASVALVIPLKKAVQPEGNPNYFYVNVEGPPGATLQDMRLIVDQVDSLIARQPETTAVFAQVGGANSNTFAGSSGVNQGAIVGVLNPARKTRVGDIRDRLRSFLRQIPDSRVTFDTNGFGAASVDMTLVSETGAGLEAAALTLQRQMGGVAGIADPRPTKPLSAAELVVRPRSGEAARLGVSAADIANIATVASIGVIDANLPKLDQGERRIPIRIKLNRADRSNLTTIENLRLPTAAGRTTTLGSIADVYFQAGPAEIDRLDRKRDVTTVADLTGDTQAGDAQSRVDALPIMRHLPPGVAKASEGQEKETAELFGGFVVAFVSAIGLVYGVMVLLFQSFFKPVVILSALPTAIGGAFLGLLVTDMPLSIPSLIGFLMLMGLAAKNSILLVEYAIERERAGVDQRHALMEACRERARPIVMTTMAMAAGMLPTALTLGKGSEFRQPMAVAVIGGLITSTILSLVLVPVVYTFVDDFERWLAPKLGRLVTPRNAPEGFAR